MDVTQMLPLFFLQILMNGLFLGMLYALMAIGLSLCLGVLKILNIPHGSFILLSCYFTYFLFHIYGLDPLISIAILFPLFFFIGIPFQKFIAFSVRRGTVESILILGFAITGVIENALLLIWRATGRAVRTSYSTYSITIGDIIIPTIYVIGLVVSIFALSMLYLFLTKTYTGKAIRSVSQDPEIASVFGVNINKIRWIAYGLSVALSAVAGAIFSMIFPFQPFSDITYLTKSLTVVVLGGLGSISGTLIGGLVLGLAECLTGGTLGIGYQNLIGLIVFLIVLTFKPKGLFGKYVE